MGKGGLSWEKERVQQPRYVQGRDRGNTWTGAGWHGRVGAVFVSVAAGRTREV